MVKVIHAFLSANARLGLMSLSFPLELKVKLILDHIHDSQIDLGVFLRETVFRHKSAQSIFLPWD